MEQKEKRFIFLSWYLLEAKYIYYCAPNLKGISDSVYDALETEYKALAEELNRVPVVALTVGFDKSKPSSKLIMEKVNKKKGITLYEEDNQ